MHSQVTRYSVKLTRISLRTNHWYNHRMTESDTQQLAALTTLRQWWHL